MKLLTIAAFAMLMSSCAASAQHRHAPPPAKAGAHTQSVRAWAWIGGQWKNSHWVPAHWELSVVHPNLLKKHPHLYIRFAKGTHRAPTRPSARHRRHHRHRH